ncbi:leucine rich adaptor protein 1-like, partial [Python bivittatus]|uniref:Leucine rich adaptor protein 1-like n=1 Tax=Python bivittatus TaxID=176946 RepID=A0A9F5IY68_PYTBI
LLESRLISRPCTIQHTAFCIIFDICTSSIFSPHGENHGDSPVTFFCACNSLIGCLSLWLQIDLRATDVQLMRQLLLINESIESIKWMIEEKGAITSRGSSLSGSLCSLLESQETSLRGSYNSLQDCSDGLDGISVGSYLDTLVDDIPGQHTPSDVDQFSDSSLIDDSQPLHKHPKIESNEYYCFG